VRKFRPAYFIDDATKRTTGNDIGMFMPSTLRFLFLYHFTGGICGAHPVSAPMPKLTPSYFTDDGMRTVGPDIHNTLPQPPSSVSREAARSPGVFGYLENGVFTPLPSTKVPGYLENGAFTPLLSSTKMPLTLDVLGLSKRRFDPSVSDSDSRSQPSPGKKSKKEFVQGSSKGKGKTVVKETVIDITDSD